MCRVTLSKKFVFTTQCEQDRLLEKQWRAKVWMRENPLAYAMSLKVKRFFRPAVMEFPVF